MHYSVAEMQPHVRRGIWNTLIAPRAVVIVSTIAPDGVPNLAPFSSLVSLSGEPALVGLTFGLRRGETKNTALNVDASGEFGVNVVTRELAKAMIRSAAGSDRVDDYERLGLARGEFVTSTATRVTDSPASLACRAVRWVDLAPSQSRMLIGEVTEVVIGDEFDRDGMLDLEAADLLASIGLEDYITLSGERLTLARTWD